ncbi:hypothetical protein DASC09_038530 [Saccharomycopsis crataegensis]|uniref:Uncharacterized protein n=1 Tax=Saccharomycopsis crataegensis TaxID=43959 RepID=A0AAV5QNS4_9ASCO|nr:hypothetical protein DASC09_038530 [Saccharomycopsis crataegensis]
MALSLSFSDERILRNLTNTGSVLNLQVYLKSCDFADLKSYQFMVALRNVLFELRTGNYIFDSQHQWTQGSINHQHFIHKDAVARLRSYYRKEKLVGFLDNMLQISLKEIWSGEDKVYDFELVKSIC